MEAYDACVDRVIAVVVPTELLGVELFPAVAWLGFGRRSIFFLQRRDFSILLLRQYLHASRGRKKVAAHAIKPARFQHVGVDKDIVARDVG